MCGIAGFVNIDGAPADAGVLAAMTNMVRHRGPDDRGSICVSLRGGIADTALGFHRLNILDLSARGHQPMTTHDGSIALVFNGAIYNAFEHKPRLEQRGCQFRSDTDTEVILALYERDGLDAMLERLDGMFALVIADTRHGAVHLIRDRFGIKPLYWAQCGAAVLFASEAKAFLAHPAFRAEIDPAQIDELLAFRYVAGEASLLRGVHHLRPGHRLTITPAGVTETRYWTIPDRAENKSLSHEAAVTRLDELLRRSVRSQLLSDVKVGCQLSGGIDSSLVSVIASSSNGAVDTFSIVPDDARFSEQRWIETAAAAAGARNHTFIFDEDTFIDALDTASWHMDQPISLPNSLALWLLAKRSRDDATVLLSGEGADEVFAGYRRFADAQLADADAFIRATQFHSDARLRKLRPDSNPQRAVDKRRSLFDEGCSDHFSNCVKYEMQTHLVDVLMRQDKMMMAHAIENRVPFLDHHVVDFARSLPMDLLIRPSIGGPPITKAIIKDLARRTFDDQFVDRRKAGFNLPLAQYFRSAGFIALMEDRLLPGMRARGIVDVDVVRRWWRRALSAPSTTEGFWIPVALELWAQQFVDRRWAS
jgi:asparagine synthase (glutamine-hydrolysing)